MGTHIELSTTSKRAIGAYLAEPTGKPKGGIVVIQEIFGVNKHIRNVTNRFAEAGYTAIAPCFFDHVEPDVELAYTKADMEKGKELVAKLSMDQAVDDVACAAAAIVSAGKVGTVGYCWGGTVALLSAMRLGLPSVSYYGGRNVQYLGEKLQAPVMFHFGEEDTGIPPEAVAKHREVLPDMDVFSYAGAGHAFDRDIDPSHYHEASSKLSRERTMAFFHKYLAAS